MNTITIRRHRQITGIARPCHHSQEIEILFNTSLTVHWGQYLSAGCHVHHLRLYHSRFSILQYLIPDYVQSVGIKHANIELILLLQDKESQTL